MKLQSHSTEDVELEKIKQEDELTATDLLRKLLDETLVAITAVTGQKKSKLELDGLRDLILAYEHIELAGMYVLRSQDTNKFDVMKEMVEDKEATIKLRERTNA